MLYQSASKVKKKWDESPVNATRRKISLCKILQFHPKKPAAPRRARPCPSLPSSRFRFHPPAKRGLPQPITLAHQPGPAGMFRTATFAQHCLPLLNPGRIPSLVLAMKSPAYFAKFRNLNRVSHGHKIARPPATHKITVVVARLEPAEQQVLRKIRPHEEHDWDRSLQGG